MVNDYKEVSIETFDSDFVVLSFDYANTVKDAGVEKYSVVYGPKENISMCLIIWAILGKIYAKRQSVTLFSRAYRLRYDIQFLSAW